ncbi:MAG: hypothetical protein RIQ53_4670 [Pseudomonadota bacterium]|jgi:hypothetical protein
MPHRVIAFLLSLFLLLGSGLASAQVGRVLAAPADGAAAGLTLVQVAEALATEGDAGHETGTPTDPLTEERPGPAELESVSEPPALPPPPGLPTGNVMVAGPPVAAIEPGFTPPFLAGPLRPPCNGRLPAA